MAFGHLETLGDYHLDRQWPIISNKYVTHTCVVLSLFWIDPIIHEIEIIFCFLHCTHQSIRCFIESFTTFQTTPSAYAAGGNQQNQENQVPHEAQKPQEETPAITKIEEHEYRFVFNSCSVGMVSVLTYIWKLIIYYTLSVFSLIIPSIITGDCVNGRGLHRLQYSILPTFTIY